MLFIHTDTVYCRFSSGPSQGNNQSICESTATTNNQSTRTSNLPASPLVQSHLSAATVLEDGYNSDACQNHNAAIEMEGPQELDEPELGEVLDPSPPRDNQAEESETNNNQPEFVLIPNNVITKMKVANLKAEQSKRGLDTKGLKNVLLDCLKQAMVDKVPVLSNSELQSDNEIISGFSETAKWKPLKPIEEPVAEPDNVVGMLHAPTTPEEDALFVPQKHNFAETFDCYPFLGCQKIPRHYHNGHQMHDPHTNQPMWNEEVNINGGPRADGLKANNLDGNSFPADWFQAFLPVFDGSCHHPWVSNTTFWMHKWANFLNMKAASMGAGVQGGMCPDFKPFSYEDIEKHLALYIIQGLSLLPQAEQKFTSQANDPVQGNDLCFCVFGSNAIHRHHHFKAFFCIQDPTKKMSCRKEHPTFKVAPFLCHVQEVSMLAWCLGRDKSVDEWTIGFQGKQSDKLCITYKAEGNGFQCDALCESGFAWTFYFHNQLAPKNYLQQGYIPLQSHILGMFDQLDEKHHNCWFDNLYLSAKFCRAAFTHPNEVCIAGPTRKSGHGLPLCVLQEEVQGTAEIRRV